LPFESLQQATASNNFRGCGPRNEDEVDALGLQRAYRPPRFSHVRVESAGGTLCENAKLVAQMFNELPHMLLP